MRRMKLIICVLSITIAGILFLSTVSSNAQEGAKISEAELSKIFEEHIKWHETERKEGQRADLRGANLIGAYLHKTDLEGANLEGAKLVWIALRGAEGLTIEQLSRAKTLYTAALDPELMEQVKEKCPHLLKEPKDADPKEGEPEFVE
jgi:uncharacterized protein YjbI with pentapeptide repeats